MKQFLFLVAIVLLGFALRVYGLNWDQGQHLHPDERFLTSVTLDTSWPTSFAQYLDTDTSPLNPQNKGHSFFVYGLFPITLIKAISTIIGKADYANITLIGRMMSAIIDTGTIILVFFIAKKLLSSHHTQSTVHSPLSVALWAALLYALMPLPIQLSHFYATDPYLTFFLTLSLLFILKKPGWHHGIFLGISLGLAAASKISAVYFFPTMAITLLTHTFHTKPIISNMNRFMLLILYGVITLVCFLVTIRLAYPYMFASSNLLDIRLNPKILANWKELEGFNNPNTSFPPALQWVHTTPYLFPFVNILWLGLGIPLSTVTIAGIAYALYQWKKNPWLLIPLVWITTVFGYQGFQFVKALRYFYPIYPALAVFAGLGISAVMSFPRRRESTRWILGSSSRMTRLIVSIIALGSISIWPIMLLSIYSRPHTRVTASQWICDYVPPGSTLATEHWDDGLPLGLSQTCNGSRYKYTELPLYNPDSDEKWDQVEQKLQTADYILLTSNRLYGSIIDVTERYPQTTIYYESLFNGSLGFKKVAEFTSRPNLPVPGIYFCFTPPGFNYGMISKSEQCHDPGITLVDDFVDETWTVYDHPKVIIFKKLNTPNTINSFESPDVVNKPEI